MTRNLCDHPTLEFATSPRSSVGIELELALVDPLTGALCSRAPEVLAAVSEQPRARFIMPELLENTIEIVSGAHASVAESVQDLRAELAEVRAAAARLEPPAEVICAGTHPFTEWFTEQVTATARYDKLIERTRFWGRNLLVWGTHIHIGVEDSAKVAPVIRGLTRFMPHLLALSGSSPYWAGVETGYASSRTLIFQQLPTAGLPIDFANWCEFEGIVDDLVRTDVISEPSEIRWDLRPSPRLGTVEIRVCDGMSRLSEIASVAALSQCLVEWFSRQIDAGETVSPLPQWFVRENKWQAARYGLSARVIVNADGGRRPIQEDILDWVDQLAPIAAELNCAAELAAVVEIIDAGSSASRQLAAAGDGKDLSAVVAHLVTELANN